MVGYNSFLKSHRHGVPSKSFPAIVVKEGAGVPDNVSAADCVTQSVSLDELQRNQYKENKL